VSLKERILLACGQIPELQLSGPFLFGLVIGLAPGNQKSTIRRQRHMIHSPVVEPEGVQYGPGRDVPDLQDTVLACRSQPLAVGREGCRTNLILMSLQAQALFPRGHIPQPEFHGELFAVSVENAARRGEGLAVRRKRQGTDLAAMTAEREA